MKIHLVPAGLIYSNREINVLELKQGNLPLNERRTLKAKENLGNHENF